MEAVLMGIASGAIVAASGYLKNKPKYDFEGFDIIMAGRTTIIGAITGGLIGATGMSPDLVATLLTSIGATVIVENLLKTIYQKFIVK